MASNRALWHRVRNSLCACPVSSAPACQSVGPSEPNSHSPTLINRCIESINVRYQTCLIADRRSTAWTRVASDGLDHCVRPSLVSRLRSRRLERPTRLCSSGSAPGRRRWFSPSRAAEQQAERVLAASSSAVARRTRPRRQTPHPSAATQRHVVGDIAIGGRPISRAGSGRHRGRGKPAEFPAVNASRRRARRAVEWR